MSRLPTFDSPFMLGFDHLEHLLDRVSKSSGEGYPPYNIERIGENGLRITLAVAGFTMDDLDVYVEDNQLVVRGRNGDNGEDRVFLHRGIAARQFQRSFVLAEGIEIKGAFLDSGLLNIDLMRQVVEPDVRTIKIKKGPPGPGSGEAKARSKTIDVEQDH